MNLKNRHLIGIGIAISLIVLNFALAIIGIPILIIVWIDYKISSKKNKENNVNEEIIEEEQENIDSIRAVIEKTEKENEKWNEYRRNVDLRQFKGRNNVTVQEIEDYLWYHKQWEGHYEKELILEEIKKVSNITDDDCREIMYEHYHHRANDGTIGCGCWVRNEEAKREIEYKRELVRRKEKEWERIFNELDKKLNMQPLKEVKNEKHQFIYYYEDWLKERGYQC